MKRRLTKITVGFATLLPLLSSGCSLFAPGPQSSASLLKDAAGAKFKQACQETAQEHSCRKAQQVEECLRASDKNPSCLSIAAAQVPTLPVMGSFLGFSQEWPWISDMTGSDHIFSIFDTLRAGKSDPLILRVGGADGDAGYDEIFDASHKKYKDEYSVMKRQGMDTAMDQLKKLKERVGFKFIATVNLANRNEEISKAQAAQIREALGDAVISFEVGNEPGYYGESWQIPHYWPNKASFYSDIVTEFDRIATAIECSPICAGPAWGWIGLRPDMMRNYLRTSGGKMNFVTVHYYKSAYDPRKPDNDTAETLIQENDVIEKWIRPQVATAKEFGVPVRLSESNAISGGGNDGVSNVFAAALWTLDTSLAMAAAGVGGIDFHQGSYKYAMYRRITKPEGSSQAEYPFYQNYRVQPSFYGMLLFQMANRDNSKISEITFDSSLKLKGYHLASAEGQRTVLINKDLNRSQTVTLLLPMHAEKANAEFIELLAPENRLTAKTGITLAGISYDEWGAGKSGSYTAQTIAGQNSFKEGYRIFEVVLKPASAGMLIIR
jgi:hypothetical protein